MYSTGNEHKLRHFVEKRIYYRKVSIICIFNLVAYSLLTEYLYPRGIPAEYRKIHYLTIFRWLFVSWLVGQYIGHELSTCPVCNNLIPTVKQEKSDTLVPGNGDLPDHCPYCNANFYKYIP